MATTQLPGDRECSEGAGLPPILYKYVAPERIDVLKNRSIRFTQLDLLNDIYECCPLFLPEDPDPSHENAALVALFKNKIAPNQLRIDRSELGVLSLSATCKGLPMWAHYADCYKGFVIGFDSSHEWFAGATRAGELRIIDYKPTYPTIRYSELNYLRQFAFIKSDEWEHEKEWRWVTGLPGSKEPENVGEFEILVRDGESIVLRKFPTASIVEIILGPRCSRELTADISLVASADDLKHITVKQARPTPGSYELAFETVTDEVPSDEETNS